MTPFVAAWWALGLAMLIAIGVPLFFVFCRHELRVQRIQVLRQFQSMMQGGDADISRLSSFEYVQEKYVADLRPFGATLNLSRPAAMAAGQTDPDVDRLRHWWNVRSSWALLAASVPFMILSMLGFYLMFACSGAEAMSDLLGKPWRPLLAVGGATAGTTYFENVLTISIMAFLGGYLFSLTILVRAVGTFDLSAGTMARVAVNLISAVAAVIIVYRTFPDLSAATFGLFDVEASAEAEETLPRFWFVAAFVFGLVPDLATNFLIGKVQDLTGAKIADASLVRQARSISLEVIDGIDFFTRFRLQQANILEVQNLAVANPIMLFVETPFGIYQTIDWVAQAQLCTAVGPERFLTLRSYNIRTIFDLERAMLSVHTTSQLRRLIGTLIMTSPPFGDGRSWNFRGIGSRSPGGGVGSPELANYIHDMLSQDALDYRGRPLDDDGDRTLKHLARIITDDVHVHRLRDIWMLISQRLTAASRALPDSEPEGLKA